MTQPPVPPIGASALLTFLLQLAALLLLAVCLGRLSVRLGMPALVGELLAGVLLGPTVLGHAAPRLAGWLFPAVAAQTHLLDAVSQLGVLLLVGITGAQLDLALFRRRGTAAARVSLGGLLLPLGLGIATGYLVPDALLPDGTRRAVFAMFLGAAMCVTAIPVIAKTLADLDLLHRNVGQLIIAAALFDDTVGWLLLAVVASMAAGGAALAGTLPLTVLYMTIFVGAACLVGRPLGRRVLRVCERGRDPGPTIAVAVVIILSYSAITAGARLEALFGAFVAGATVLGLADPTRLAPLRTIVMSVLAPIFLAGIGLRMDLTTLGQPLVLLTGIAVLLVATLGKFLGAYLGARAGRLSHREGLALGIGMNSRGMIEVIIAMAGLRLGVLTTATFTMIVLVAIVTSLTTPPLLRLVMRGFEPDAEERSRQQRQAAWSTTRAA